MSSSYVSTLLGMMSTIAVLYSIPLIFTAHPQLQWCWVVVSVLLIIWSVLNVVLCIRGTLKINNSDMKRRCHGQPCIDPRYSTLHLVLLILSIGACVYLTMYTGGLAPTNIVVLVYPILAMVLPVCIHVAYLLLYGPAVDRTKNDHVIRRDIGFRLGTRIWAPSEKNQWGT